MILRSGFFSSLIAVECKITRCCSWTINSTSSEESPLKNVAFDDRTESRSGHVMLFATGAGVEVFAFLFNSFCNSNTSRWFAIRLVRRTWQVTIVTLSCRVTSRYSSGQVGLGIPWVRLYWSNSRPSSEFTTPLVPLASPHSNQRQVYTRLYQASSRLNYFLEDLRADWVTDQDVEKVFFFTPRVELVNFEKLDPLVSESVNRISGGDDLDWLKNWCMCWQFLREDVDRK